MAMNRLLTPISIMLAVILLVLNFPARAQQGGPKKSLRK
jgi:hypothetical protein